MRYDECLEFLFSQLPMYQRMGAAAYKADLSNTLALCEWSGFPQDNFPCIHIAGTNGKGSVSHLLASVLQEQGYTVGLYTSPHLRDFRERIRVNGELIEREFVLAFVERLQKDWAQLALSPSFFEMTVILAFEYFAMRKVDVAVIETGMGGRLDSTNVIWPIMSIITNIGLDHTKFLGDTIEDIAKEKAGIIKEKVPVVLGEMNEKAAVVCRVVAEGLHSKVLAVKDYEIEAPTSALKGKFQDQNRKTAYLACLELNELGWSLSKTSIQNGFLKVIESTGLKGRWQELSSAPYTIADVAHNADGIAAIVEEIKLHAFQELHVVIGLSDDKDAGSMLSQLPIEATYYFCRPNVPRGKDAETLKLEASNFGLIGESYSTVAEAYTAARLQASKEDMIFIGGSFFVVAEVV